MCQKELPPFFIQNHNSFPNISSHQFNNLGAFSLQLEPSPRYGFSSDDQDHHTMVGTITITIIRINITSKLTWIENTMTIVPIHITFYDYSTMLILYIQ